MKNFTGSVNSALYKMLINPNSWWMNGWVDVNETTEASLYGRRLRFIARAVLNSVDVVYLLFLFSTLPGTLYSQTLNLFSVKTGHVVTYIGTRNEPDREPLNTKIVEVSEIYRKTRRAQRKLTFRSQFS